MKPNSVQGVLPAALAVSLLLSVATRAADPPVIDANDKDALERALYLCIWKTNHAVPEHAPTPAVCRSPAVSVDDALLQTKQWWMYWARFDNEGVVKANTQFGEDFVDFQVRQRRKPEMAEKLLPSGIRLANEDWRLMLVQELKSRAATTTP